MQDEVEQSPEPQKTWDEYWALVRRRRWWFLAPAFLTWLAIWGASWLLPSAYESQSLIMIDRQKVPREYVIPNVTTELQERLQSITQQILSRTELLRMIDQYNLYAKKRDRLAPEELVELMRKDVKIEVAPGKARDELTAFTISYSAHDPKVAQAVTSELTTLFINANLQSREDLAENTTEFLKQQLDAAGKSLAEQEERVRDFKSRHLGQLPAQMQSNVEILAGLQGQAQRELDSLNQAKQQATYLTSLLEQYRSVQRTLGEGNSTQVPITVEQNLADLKIQLAAANVRYTSEHPEVRKLKAAIAELEKIRLQVPTSDRAAPANKLLPRTYTELQAAAPMMQVEGQLKANQLEIQNREREIAALHARIEEYRGRLNLTPVREQQLSDLTRGYDQARANYDSLLAKKNQSELATNLEKRQQGEQFRLLDRPSLPQKPSSPNRPKLCLIALAAGIAMGLATCVAAEVSIPRVYCETDLKDLVAVAVLAQIPPLPLVHEARRRSRMRVVEWAASAVMLLVVTAGTGFTLYRG